MQQVAIDLYMEQLFPKRNISETFTVEGYNK